MPDFYLVPKRIARAAPALVKAAQTVEGWAFRFIFAVVRALSIESAMKLAGFAFWLPGPYSDKAQKARDNLAIAFPDKSEEWRETTMREIFRNLGYSAVELIKLEQIWEERDKRLEVVLQPGAKKHLEEGGAAIFITAHVGPWQVAPLMLRPYENVIPHVIYAPESNPVMHDILQEMRLSLGKLISAEAGPRPILRALNNGESVIMAMDTRPDTGKMVPFFGRDALTNTSAVGLALRSNAKLMLGRGERLPGARYRLTMYDPLENPLPDADIKDQAAALTEIVHGYFEQWIRETPEQWICLKRRWPKAHKL